MLQDDHNAPLIERDLKQAFWINHAYLDVFASVVMEYFSRDRSDHESYIDKWDRWVRDDWYRAYVLKLGGLGLEISPEIFERARERLTKGIHHRMAMLAFALWPVNYWRFDPLDERDFEWFEEKYPGWYDTYGGFWEQFRNSTDPGADSVPMELVSMAPPFCWTCQMPCVLEDERTHRTVEERTRFYCSKECQWLDESNPGRYGGDRNYFDRYHGWELSEIVADLGFLRADGKTMIAQPHLGDDGRWTLEHLRARGIEIASPNIRLAEELGLPSGDWSNGAVPAAAEDAGR